MTSLVSLASNLVPAGLVNTVFVSNAMEVAMRIVETSKWSSNVFIFAIKHCLILLLWRAAR
jgi:hypothetical protein